MKLDKTKWYGVVYGHHTAKYEQNGRLFDQEFNRIDRPILTVKKGKIDGLDKRDIERKREQED